MNLSRHRPGAFLGRPALAGLLLCLAACAAAPSGQEPAAPEGQENRGSLEELKKLLEEAEAQSLEGRADAPQDPALVPPAEAGDPVSPEALLQDPAQVPGTPPGPPAGPPPAEAQISGPLESPYLVFGPRIVVHPDGRITKPYPVPPKKGRKLLDLIALYGNLPLKYTIIAAADGPDKVPTERPGPDEVELVLLEDWDFEYYQDLRKWPPDAVTTHAVADWLVVTAERSQLEDVEHFLNLFAGYVPQIEIEASIVEVTELEGLDIGVSPPAGQSTFDFPDGVLIDSLSAVFPNDESASEALLSLGAVQDGTAFNAILEAVSTWENVAIDSRPRVAVREGGRAEIIQTQEIPYYSLGGITSTGGFSAQLQFKEVGIKLYIVPRVVGTETLALNIDIEASQQLGTAVSFSQTGATPGASDQTINVPVIAKRMARTVVYLEPGQALILGGLTNTRDSETVKKVPLLGDIPLLGYLFKSRLTRKEKNTVLFFIRPRILQGIDLQRDF